MHGPVEWPACHRVLALAAVLLSMPSGTLTIIHTQRAIMNSFVFISTTSHKSQYDTLVLNTIHHLDVLKIVNAKRLSNISPRTFCTVVNLFISSYELLLN